MIVLGFDGVSKSGGATAALRDADPDGHHPRRGRDGACLRRAAAPARALTFAPFTAGPLVMLRANLDPASLAWWEVVGAILVLLASSRLALRLGTRSSLREIIRQARLSAD
jgi:hypothetical protein